MAVDGRFDNIELQEVDNVIYESIENTTEPTAQEKDLRKKLQSVKRRHKRVGVGVGLLVAVLALLSVAVPVYLYQTNVVEREQLVNSNNKLTEEKDQLQDRYTKVTEERDDLKKWICGHTDYVKRKFCETDGFTFADGLCYYISTVTSNWMNSRQWCRERQSDLMVIKSRGKQDFVEGVNKTVWLGLTDRDEEGSFKWVDGTPLTTPTYWLPGQPNNNLIQDCVMFYNGLAPDTRGWDDNWCLSYNLWICERVLC